MTTRRAKLLAGVKASGALTKPEKNVALFLLRLGKARNASQAHALKKLLRKGGVKVPVRKNKKTTTPKKTKKQEGDDVAARIRKLAAELTPAPTKPMAYGYCPTRKAITFSERPTSEAYRFIEGVHVCSFSNNGFYAFAPMSRCNYDALRVIEKDGRAKVMPEVWEAFAGQWEYKDGIKLRLKGLLLKPRKYQKEGVRFMASRRGRALLADDMGLGKTGQVICFLYHMKQKKVPIFPVVVVCPNNLKETWKREIRKWSGRTFTIRTLQGKTPQGRFTGADIIIINYDIIDAWKDDLRKVVKTLVLDEAHYIKNYKSKRTQACIAISEKAKRAIAMTGTPIKNKILELFPVFRVVDPTLFASALSFERRYGQATQKDVSSLHALLHETIMIRRLKGDVLKELPPKSRVVVPVEIDNRKEYERAEGDLIKWIADTFPEDIAPEKIDAALRAEALVKMGVLKKIVVEGKMRAALIWIRDFLEQGEKLVIFAHHKDIIERLFVELAAFGVVGIHGGSKKGSRQAAVDLFMNDPAAQVFVGSKAAIEGLTLTSASNTCFLELWWTPADHDQAEDRVHRIGQIDSVTAWYLLGEDTVEGRIAEAIDSKRRLVSQVVDGVAAKDETLLLALLSEYKAGRHTAKTCPKRSRNAAKAAAHRIRANSEGLL